jgi:hypothetical protein
MTFPEAVIKNGMVAIMALATQASAAETFAAVHMPRAGADGGPVKVFISGHSLTQQPMPDYLKEIAAADGVTLEWGMQHLPGSSILQRLGEQNPFTGASAADGTGGPAAGPYQVMIITEQHRVLDSLIWQDTVNSLRAYQDRFIAANQGGQTYFYAPWISFSDRADPSDWIEFEQHALPVWQCVVAQVNLDIAAVGRADRIGFIPTSLALASLVERLTADGADLPGFEGYDVTAKMNALFVDEVHLTPLGAYFAAAVSYATMAAIDAPLVTPPSLDPQQARSVTEFADTFMRTYRTAPVPSDAQCAAGISLAYAVRYTAYTERTYHRAEEGYVSARIKRVRDTLRFAWRFRNGLK